MASVVRTIRENDEVKLIYYEDYSLISSTHFSRHQLPKVIFNGPWSNGFWMHRQESLLQSHHLFNVGKMWARRKKV